MKKSKERLRREAFVKRCAGDSVEQLLRRLTRQVGEDLHEVQVGGRATDGCGRPQYYCWLRDMRGIPSIEGDGRSLRMAIMNALREWVRASP